MANRTARQELVDSAIDKFRRIENRSYHLEQCPSVTQGFESLAHLACEAVLDGQGWHGCDTTTIGYAMLCYYVNASELAITRLFNEIERKALQRSLRQRNS